MALFCQQIILDRAVAPEVIAAITAAVAAYMQTETGWQITAIRPLKENNKRWVLAGRQELMGKATVFERRRRAG
ncbi:MAG: hypothetical protein IMW95_00875 [Moorella humiferrea]|uniref:Uncharacterized protein n=1 Tax=Neomoorella humiferrea TaxID=676965 RepID=A0A2T0AXL1_9FIRM|nr:hypothetical protein [Moorella humiferrea]MBE3571498.1 hypothetical protein [Moorella humiferrea]PRR75550.1 hypothetical protein MOHU_03170 [Moorella humiferrea]